MARANRLAFISKDNTLLSINYNFEWFSGLSISQLRKSINSFHNEIKRSGFKEILEVSRKSENELGTKLSAFNLMINIKGITSSVESFYHSSKVFGEIQFYECMNLEAKDSKKYIQDKVENLSLKLSGFNFMGMKFDLNTRSMCYDYIYIMGLKQNEDVAKEILKYECFTDIVYNPKKLVACQARTCALYKYLRLNNMVDKFLTNPHNFVDLYNKLF